MIPDRLVEAAARALYGNDSLWAVALAAQKQPWLDRAERALSAVALAGEVPIEAAEARGYARAVAALRDHEAYARWYTRLLLPDFPDVIPHRDDWRNNVLAADYLEATADTLDPKETTA
jgi:hypothetical protein